MLENVAIRILQFVFGGGGNITGANPIPVSGVIAATTLTVDPFTGTGNIAPAAVRSSAADAFRACKVTIRWSVATSNPVTIALVANAGPAYDTVLRVITMGANTDLVYYFPENAKFEAGDVITVAWTDDTGGAATWGVEITWEE